MRLSRVTTCVRVDSLSQFPSGLKFVYVKLVIYAASLRQTEITLMQASVCERVLCRLCHFGLSLRYSCTVWSFFFRAPLPFTRKHLAFNPQKRSLKL